MSVCVCVRACVRVRICVASFLPLSLLPALSLSRSRSLSRSPLCGVLCVRAHKHVHTRALSAPSPLQCVRIFRAADRDISRVVDGRHARLEIPPRVRKRIARVHEKVGSVPVALEAVLDRGARIRKGLARPRAALLGLRSRIPHTYAASVSCAVARSPDRGRSQRPSRGRARRARKARATPRVRARGCPVRWGDARGASTAHIHTPALPPLPTPARKSRRPPRWQVPPPRAWPPARARASPPSSCRPEPRH